MKSLHGLGLGLLLSICGVLAVAEPGASAPALNIAPGPLGQALTEFAQQSGLQVILDARLAEGMRSPGVSGTFSAEAALRRLLGETSFKAEWLDGHTVAIRAVGAGETAAVAGDGKDGEGMRRVAQAEEQKASSDAAAEESDGGSVKLEEVVVTAQKRKESLQDVPISIAVLNGKDLDGSTQPNVADALRSVPSLDLGQSGFVGGSLISMRGVGNSSYREGGSSTTAYYVDGTPYGLVRSAIVPLDADLYDLERIEVLRGPQGTLYGANALNGVIRVLTHDADTKAFELKARTFLSSTQAQDGGENYGGNLAVNVPLIQDKLAVRGVIGYRRDSGWIQSPIDQNINSSKLQSYRLKLRAEPTDTLTIDLSAWHSKSNRGAPSLSDDDRRITSIQDESQEIEYDVFGAEITKDFAGFSVTSMTSYIDSQNSGALDGSPLDIPLVIIGDLKSKVLTEELNIVSQQDGPWRWSVGAFYRDAEDDTFQLRDWLPALEALGFPDTTINNDYRDTSKSVAVYGELGRRFFDDELEFSVGLRYFHDEQTLQILSPYVDLPLTPIRSSAEAVTPRTVLTWSPSSASSFYASYSQGFRSGLAQAPNIQDVAPEFPPARPDKLHNYEVGAKGSLLGARLSYEAAAYYIDWQKVQVPLFVPVIPGSVDATVVVNPASASGLGAEFALVARPTDGLELGPNFSWSGLSIDNTLRDATGNVVLPKGGRLGISPEYTAGVFARYSFPLGSDAFMGEFAMSGNYKSALVFYELRGAEVVSRRGDARFDGGSVSFSIEARDRWTAKLFVDNVTNQYRSEVPIGQSGVPADFEWRNRSRPRTIGAQLEYRFE